LQKETFPAPPQISWNQRSDSRLREYMKSASRAESRFPETGGR
jgi:hypothetical protein